MYSALKVVVYSVFEAVVYSVLEVRRSGGAKCVRSCGV